MRMTEWTQEAIGNEEEDLGLANALVNLNEAPPCPSPGPPNAMPVPWGRVVSECDKHHCLWNFTLAKSCQEFLFQIHCPEIFSSRMLVPWEALRHHL